MSHVSGWSSTLCGLCACACVPAFVSTFPRHPKANAKRVHALQWAPHSGCVSNVAHGAVKGKTMLNGRHTTNRTNLTRAWHARDGAHLRRAPSHPSAPYASAPRDAKDQFAPWPAVILNHPSVTVGIGVNCRWRLRSIGRRCRREACRETCREGEQLGHPPRTRRHVSV